MDASVIDANIGRLERGECFSDGDRWLCDLLIGVCGTFPDRRPTVRIVGGYVRDALLGVPSDDIDITLEDAPLEEFAERLRAATGFGRSSVALIEPRPEQAKLVRTARIHVSPERWVDICSLQCQSGETATPATDAARRDFTVNSLFLNINAGRVEDFAGGVGDLKLGLLRTPIAARETFETDPLRILRCFRFAARFNMRIDAAIFEAAAQVADDFGHKIARERIQAELQKVMASGRAADVLEWLVECRLFMATFNPDGQWRLTEDVAVERARTALGRCQSPGDCLAVLLAAVYFDCASLPPGRRKVGPVDAIIIRFMAMPAGVATAVTVLIQAAHAAPDVIGNLSRVAVGRWLRRAGAGWRLVRCLLFDPAVLARWDEEVISFVSDQQLEQVIAMRPLLNGKELQTLHRELPGPRIAALLENLIGWQIEHPGATADDYRAAVATE
jgi:tRNA nucleotidyltransferase (CCA-adding enzyme)